MYMYWCIKMLKLLIITQFFIGGLSLKIQEAELRKRPDIVIATPGRFIDHVRNSYGFSPNSIEIIVIDEADRILDEGFQDELNEIIKICPKSRQTILFSATMTDKVKKLKFKNLLKFLIRLINSLDFHLINLSDYLLIQKILQ